MSEPSFVGSVARPLTQMLIRTAAGLTDQPTRFPSSAQIGFHSQSVSDNGGRAQRDDLAATVGTLHSRSVGHS
jgi:hypothetical protein